MQLFETRAGLIIDSMLFSLRLPHLPHLPNKSIVLVCATRAFNQAHAPKVLELVIVITD